MTEPDIEIMEVQERQLKWTPAGYHWTNRLTALIRNGTLEEITSIGKEVIRDDPDGVIAFIMAIRKAMAETSKID